MVKLTLAGAPDAIFDITLNDKSLQRLEISLCPVAVGQDDKDISELILVVMLYRMVDLYATQSIEWLDPTTKLTVEQFLGAFTNISPRRVHLHQQEQDGNDAPFHSVAETEEGLVQRDKTFAGQSAFASDFDLIDLTAEETLSLAYRFKSQPDENAAPIAPEEQAQNDIRRLATWGMTGMVAFLSTPVAISMVAVNLVRGEDFRLNTNVLSLTGFLVMLQSSGALASAVSYLPL
jgi:hypothetical protein